MRCKKGNEMAFRPIRGYNDRTRYPSTEYSLRHIHRNIELNGLGDAFARVGNRVLFDPDRLQELLADRSRERGKVERAAA